MNHKTERLAAAAVQPFDQGLALAVGVRLADTCDMPFKEHVGWARVPRNVVAENSRAHAPAYRIDSAKIARTRALPRAAPTLSTPTPSLPGCSMSNGCYSAHPMRLCSRSAHHGGGLDVP